MAGLHFLGRDPLIWLNKYHWKSNALHHPAEPGPLKHTKAETPRRSLSTYEWCAAALLPNLQSQERAIIDAVAPADCDVTSEVLTI